MSELHHNGKVDTFKTASQEMGYVQELEQFIECVAGKQTNTVALSQSMATMDVIFAIEHSLANATTVRLSDL